MVSNLGASGTDPRAPYSFHPLYRGTWFPTYGLGADGECPSVSIRYIAVLGFQLLLSVQSTALPSKFPSAISRYLVSNREEVQNWHSTVCFHPLYRGTWFPTQGWAQAFEGLLVFPSAISRYLVSNQRDIYHYRWVSLFPSAISRYLVSNCIYSPTLDPLGPVSIRYIAVLGFQPYQKNTPSDQRRRKRFTHPPSNRSHSHICFLKSR